MGQLGWGAGVRRSKGHILSTVWARTTEGTHQCAGDTIVRATRMTVRI